MCMQSTALRLTREDVRALGLDVADGVVAQLDDAQLKMVLGARLLRALDVRDVSQAQLARLLGCSRSVVSRWCDGTNLISMKTMLQIAGLLKTAPGELLPDVERFASPNRG